MGLVPLPLDTWRQQLPLTLLIDRDMDTRRMYATYFELAHYRIEQAEDGREALAKAISHRPDIVVTDTRLPGISGLELCSLLRNDALTRHIPIVVVTGNGLELEVKRASTAGADTVFVKPCPPEVLFGEVRRLLDLSVDVRARAVRAREDSAEQFANARRLIERSQAQNRRLMLSRSHDRHETVQPPLPPPQLVCPQCDTPLRYRRSHIGGVSVRNSEQWDYFECAAGCGEFQYRQRTRKLRKTS
jgi:two-component system cell cycle response regulator DivK